MHIIVMQLHPHVRIHIRSAQPHSRIRRIAKPDRTQRPQTHHSHALHYVRRRLVAQSIVHGNLDVGRHITVEHLHVVQQSGMGVNRLELHHVMRFLAYLVQATHEAPVGVVHGNGHAIDSDGNIEQVSTEDQRRYI